MKKMLLFLIVGLFLVGGVVAPAGGNRCISLELEGNISEDCINQSYKKPSCPGEGTQVDPCSTDISNQNNLKLCYESPISSIGASENDYTFCENGCEDGACIETPTTKVCCHKFGYGSMMKKVNSQYVLIEESDCTVPDDFVGGGREVVDDSNCQNQIKEKIKTRLKTQVGEGECPEECTCTGSAMKCVLASGREMTITAGKSGNTIVQVKGANMSTKVELYKNENGELVGVFRGTERVIKVDPDQVKEKIRERLKQKTCDCDEMELDEDGNYQVQTRKQARLFFIVPVKEKVKMQVNSETGEITRTRTSWWGWMARDDVEEEVSEE
ncbi:MAG: hypothetical protein ABIB79_04910 [archaeon]